MNQPARIYRSIPLSGTHGALRRRTSFETLFLSQEVVGISAFGGESFFESLILAQDERWRRALGMQVDRGPQGLRGRRVSNA